VSQDRRAGPEDEDEAESAAEDEAEDEAESATEDEAESAAEDEAESATEDEAESAAEDEAEKGASASGLQMDRRQTSVVIVAVFVSGLCSIVYELLIGTTSSYFLGDSITQFSITIGLFMAAMGFGSFLSRRLGDRVLGRFVALELMLGCVGGLSVPVLYFVFAYTDLYTPAMVLFIVAVGTLTGLEVPMLVLVMRRRFSLKRNLSNILSLDYVGALGATLVFPFVLLPLLGTFRSAVLVGLVNVVLALVVLRAFRDEITARQRYQALGIGSAILLAGLFFASPRLLQPWHGAVYEDRVVHVQQSAYQKIVLTRGRTDLRMFLDGNLQFSSIDEYRYHEALIHPAMAAAQAGTAGARRVLVLGGGDGLGVRELLKHPAIERIDLVDLDPAVTRIAREHPLVRELNKDALLDKRVHLHHRDAFVFLEREEATWDVIVSDLPDPNNASLARLYSREFYGLVVRRLARAGVLVAQATSPFFARKAYWCIDRTIRSAGLKTLPFHAYIPSFGDWGFVLAARHRVRPPRLDTSVSMRFLDDEVLARLFVFPKDLSSQASQSDAEPSTLDRPLVLSYYLAGWRHWN